MIARVCAVQLFLLLALLFKSTAVFSQGFLAGENTQKILIEHFDKMQTQVGYSDAQKRQLMTVAEIYAEKYKALAKEEASRWKKIRKARSIQKQQLKLVRDILNEEQFDAYELYMKSVKQEARKRLKSKKAEST